MKLPGKPGRQGIPIEQLDVDPDLTIREAVALARKLGADAEYNDVDDYAHVPLDFVTTALDFEPGEVFLYESADGDERLHEVASDSTFTDRLEVRKPGTRPRDPEHEPMEWSAIGHSYAELWLAWLQGRVVPVETETRYVRMDSGEEVAP